MQEKEKSSFAFVKRNPLLKFFAKNYVICITKGWFSHNLLRKRNQKWNGKYFFAKKSSKCSVLRIKLTVVRNSNKSANKKTTYLRKKALF